MARTIALALPPTRINAATEDLVTEVFLVLEGSPSRSRLGWYGPRRQTSGGTAVYPKSEARPRLMIARHGSLAEAIGFSVCLPILGPPQVRGREMFIDGALVDNLPVRSMADLGEGPIIAVDVKATLEQPAGKQRTGSEGHVGGRDGGRPARVPTLGETLGRVLSLGSANTSEAARRHADLVIKPHAEGVGLLEFHQMDVAVEAGRVAARAALEDAPGSLFSVQTE
jgi:predicted acylesterase/phospholipase RssA